jgi:glycerol-3-phosphate acyltransferase PlsY
MIFMLWLAGSFLSGACMFSAWIGQRLLGQDIRHFGDGNPGATNVLLAGGRRLAVIALLLDFFKGALPVALANFAAGIGGWQLALVAVMPVAGHAFSPFLKGRGGKAVAVTFGAWSGLTLWEGTVAAGLFLSMGTLLCGLNGWAVMTSMLGLLLYILFIPGIWYELPLRPDSAVLLGAWAANVAILVWKHRGDLASWPDFSWRSKPLP